jgi:polyisoprenoid-binding protein YceI
MKTWEIDTAHSRIQFKVRHLMVSLLKGEFRTYEGTMEAQKDDFTDAKIKFSAEVESIDTGNETRDNHLKTADFFDAKNFSTIKFISAKINKTDGNNYKLTGNLTIRDKTLPVTLDVIYNGTVKNSTNRDVAGFEITGKLNRKDFGLRWNSLTEKGLMVAGDEVTLDLTVEMMIEDYWEKTTPVYFRPV